MAVGRISGPLLKANLLRNGVDLAFENDLLYLDVVNARIGVKTTTPSTDLHINGTTRTTTLTVDTQFNIGTFTVSGNTISSSSSAIYFQASAGEATVYHTKLQIDDLQITNNTISTTVLNRQIEIKPNGTGTVELVAPTNITGNLYVSGNITATGDVTIGGNITIGDTTSDTVSINASIQSDLIPKTTNLYNLGSSDYKWKALYTTNLHTNNINLTSINIGNITLQSNTISTSGNMYLNGTNGVNLANFNITDNTITNTSNNAVTQFVQTGTGYVKIGGTNGFVPPTGGVLTRPTSYAVLGMMRYNTDSFALEIWNGSSWASPTGASGSVSNQTAIEISLVNALIF